MAGGGGLHDLDEVDWDLFSLGTRFGLAVLLLVWVLWDCVMDVHLRPKGLYWTSTVLIVYRGLGCLLLAAWCWLVSLWVWTRAGINYMYLFGLPLDGAPSLRNVFR